MIDYSNPFGEELADPHQAISVADPRITAEVVVVPTNADPRRSKCRHRARIKLSADPRTVAKLRELAAAHGYTVGALIRYCIDRQLPHLEARLNTIPGTPG
jgi:hypothetical protein